MNQVDAKIPAVSEGGNSCFMLVAMALLGAVGIGFIVWGLAVAFGG